MLMLHTDNNEGSTLALLPACRRLFLFLMLLVLASCGHANEQNNRTIEVSGTAKQSIAADMATFTFAVNVRGQDLVELKTDVDSKTAGLVTLCKQLGIAKKDISSAEVSIHPQYNQQTRTLLGYSVSRTVKVTLRDLANYTELMNGAIAAGVNTVGRIMLDVESRDELQRRALASAVADARNKADILAKSAGVTVGEVMALRETAVGSGVEPYRFAERAVSASARGAFEPGEISLTTTVSVKYAIK